MVCCCCVANSAVTGRLCEGGDSPCTWSQRIECDVEDDGKKGSPLLRQISRPSQTVAIREVGGWLIVWVAPIVSSGFFFVVLTLEGKAAPIIQFFFALRAAYREVPPRCEKL